MQSADATYSHRQTGQFIKHIVAIATGVVAVAIYMAAPQHTWLALLAIVIAMGVTFVFGSMTIQVADGSLSWWFGPGVWRKSVPLRDIAAAEQVRNKWWWGWGIRYYGKGWLYNVSGLDAVEVTLKDGKMLRLGTDDPAGLAAFLRQAIA